MAKQDNSIHLVQEFQPINLQLERSEHPLPTIEVTLVNIGTFLGHKDGPEHGLHVHAVV